MQLGTFLDEALRDCRLTHSGQWYIKETTSRKGFGRGDNYSNRNGCPWWYQQTTVRELEQVYRVNHARDSINAMESENIPQPLVESVKVYLTLFLLASGLI